MSLCPALQPHSPSDVTPTCTAFHRAQEEKPALRPPRHTPTTSIWPAQSKMKSETLRKSWLTKKPFSIQSQKINSNSLKEMLQQFQCRLSGTRLINAGSQTRCLFCSQQSKDPQRRKNRPNLSLYSFGLRNSSAAHPPFTDPVTS